MATNVAQGAGRVFQPAPAEADDFSKCWFCRTQTPDNAFATAVALSDWKLPYTPERLFPNDQYLLVHVPRCKDCAERHQKSQQGGGSVSKALTNVVGVVCLIAFLVVLFNGGKVGVLAVIGAGIVALIIPFAVSGWLSSKALGQTRGLEHARQFPTVVSLLGEGWTFKQHTEQ